MLRRPYGPTAWWIEDLADPGAWANGCWRLATDRGLDGVVDVVPAETTVVVLTTAAARDAIGEVLDTVVPLSSEAAGDVVEIAVRYGGPDLVEVAERTGLGVDGLIEAHSAARYRVGFCGFSPGFAYLLGLPPELQLPRRDRPRTNVPAGSVAIAARYTAVYPSASPGGWHLIGRTDAVIWDLGADPPARLRPGTPVRFRPV